MRISRFLWRNLHRLSNAALTAVTLTSSSPSLAYVGFAGEGNLGDDAIHEGLSMAMDQVDLPIVYRFTQTHATWTQSLARLRRSPVGVLLAGGTLLFRHGWLEKLEAVCGSLPALPRFTVGVAVETSHDLVDHARIDDWTKMLNTFEHVSVRDYVSQRSLADLGIQAPVCGDPALLLGQGLKLDPGDRLLAINVGSQETIYGDREDLVVASVAKLAEHFGAQGWKTLLLPMERRDIPLVQGVVSAYPAARVLDVDVAGFLEVVRRCTLVVGQRLHAVVLAHAAYVPAISLAYRPKCLAYAESMGTQDWTLPTDELSSPDYLIELAQVLVDSRDEESRRLERVVKDKVGRLRRSCHEIVSSQALIKHL